MNISKKNHTKNSAVKTSYVTCVERLYEIKIKIIKSSTTRRSVYRASKRRKPF